MRARPLYDVVALLTRLGVGAVFIVHGWRKIQVGVTATARDFDTLGVPAPTPAAIYATFVELLGGVAFILGIGLPVAGLLLFLDMAGAFVFVHAENGLLVVDGGKAANGYELVLLLGLVSLLFAVGGGGRLAIDHRLLGGAKAGRAGTPATPSGSGDPEPTSASASASASAPTGSGASDRRPSSSKSAGGPSSSGVTSGGTSRSAASAVGTSADRTATRSATPEPVADTAEPSPRLAADIVGDTSGDQSADRLVAGRKGRPRRKSSATATGTADQRSPSDPDERDADRPGSAP